MVRWIIILGVIIGLLLAILFVRPALYLDDVGFDTELKIAKGCYTTIDGEVLNQGFIEARDVVIKCRLIGDREVNDSKNLGKVPPRAEIDFSIGVNHDCPAPDDVECFVSCGNCWLG